ncbi:MAG: hypothetical protein R3337_00090 [Gammaproteobacteria bacterium]|nr:hypothetical protein [Gammaproteobacteria bacterium]
MIRITVAYDADGPGGEDPITATIRFADPEVEARLIAAAHVSPRHNEAQAILVALRERLGELIDNSIDTESRQEERSRADIIDKRQDMEAIAGVPFSDKEWEPIERRLIRDTLRARKLGKRKPMPDIDPPIDPPGAQPARPTNGDPLTANVNS